MASFLGPMLEINAERRADAGGMSNHAWIQSAFSSPSMSRSTSMIGAGLTSSSPFASSSASASASKTLDIQFGSSGQVRLPFLAS